MVLMGSSKIQLIIIVVVVVVFVVDFWLSEDKEKCFILLFSPL